MEIYTFDAPTTCRHCSKFLKGRIHQGYRCKVCQISVHRGCISSTGRCKQNPVSIPPPVCDRQLSEFNWFVGNMDRETAANRLENRRIGTYLLRVRPQGASSPPAFTVAIFANHKYLTISAQLKLIASSFGIIIIQCSGNYFTEGPLQRLIQP